MGPAQGRAFLALLFWLVLASDCAAMLCLDRAQMVARSGGQTVAQDVLLPYNWDKHQAGKAGQAVFTLEFGLDTLPSEPWAIFIARIGNAFQASINNIPVAHKGDVSRPNAVDQGLEPHLIALAPNLLRDRNTVRIELLADMGRLGGLTQVCLGSERELRPVFTQAYQRRTITRLLVCLFSLAAGVLALALWAMQVSVTAPGASRPGPRDPLFLYAGAAELAWAFSNGSGLTETIAIPWPWLGLLSGASSVIWISGMTMVCLHALNLERSGVRPWLFAWLALECSVHLSAVALALWQGRLLWVTASYGLLAVGNLLLGGIFVFLSVRHKAVGPRLLSLAFVVNVMLGVRDLQVLRLHSSYGEVSWIRYSSLLFGLALVYLMLTRFRELGAQARAFQSTLQQRVTQRERELAQSYEKLEALARGQERNAERNRILRDMHDGVGSNLSAAIRQLQSGRSDPDQLLMTLRESLDHLKLSIDAMHLTPGDITGMLANLRYRFEARFEASDIRLHWEVEQIEPIEGLDAKAMQQLQFVVFGALSNVLQHAQASELAIEARRVDRGVLLRVADNGIGFDTKVPWRRGLLSMKDRAESIDAEFRIQSRPGRTAVEMIIF